jgi:rhamnosyltransferase subunit B
MTATQHQQENGATPLIIVATSGTSGDIVPFTTLAKGLLERGNRVVMLVPTFHEPLMQLEALPYEVIGTVSEFQAILNNANLWDERKGFGVVWKGIQPHLGVIREMVGRQPSTTQCMLLCHPILMPLADIAKRARPDLHVVCAYLAPSNLCSSHDFLTAGSLRIPRWAPLAWRRSLWRLINKVWIDPEILPSLNQWRLENKLPAASGFFEHISQSADTSIGLFPDWFASVQPDWPSPFIEGNFPAVHNQTNSLLNPSLEDFLAQGEAPIAFTPGTGHRHATDYFAIALKTLKKLGHRGLFITPHAAQVPHELPSNVMWLAHAPFELLLPRLSALVHHGGIGTTAEAFRAGIPQLVVPYAFDQFDNGLRAKNFGVAEVILAKRLTARRLQKGLAKLLGSEQVKQNCNLIANKLKHGPEPSWLIQQVEVALGLAPSSPINTKAL